MAIFKKLGIDLGTANSLVWEVGKGLILNEPTVVAISVEDQKVLAVGKEAKLMLGRTPEFIFACRPMRDGVIADYETTEAMLRYFIQKVCGKFFFFKPEIMICVPAGVTQVEQRAVLDATMSAGARVAYLIDEPLAAAIGARVPVSEPSGNMIVDMGGGSTEAAVISLGGVVTHKSLRVAGNKIDDAVAAYLRKKHGILVGEQTAEEVKIKLGSAVISKKKKSMEVKGRDSIYGLPKSVEVTNDEITEAISGPLKQILAVIKGVLEETPPELVSDIVDKGIVLSGGTSLLRNLDKFLSENIDVAFHRVEEPMLSVVKGTALALENMDLYQRAVRKK
ncbi:MAG: rod shape-determining protein [Patescibacteria group bacterium]|nr:rod shape-determining protein [Patescibacteria group bacterium]